MSTIHSTPQEDTPLFSPTSAEVKVKSVQDLSAKMNTTNNKNKKRYGTLAVVLSGLALTAISGYQYSSSTNGGGGVIRPSTSLVSMETKMELALDLADTTPCEVKCAKHSIHVGGYQCSDTDNKPTRTTYVCYPTSGTVTTNFPVVLFQRGSSGWFNKHSSHYESWMKKIAEQCLVVIAPMTSGQYSYNLTTPEAFSPRAKACATDVDLITAYSDAQDNWKNWTKADHKDTKPNWNRTGAGAHSAGAHHLPTFQMLFYQKYNRTIQAVVYSHGGSPDFDPDDAISKHYKPDLDNCLTWKNAKDSEGQSVCAGIPAFFLTASKDKTVDPRYPYNWFMKLTNEMVKRPNEVDQAVFVAVKDGTHMEPVKKGVLNVYTARFFACHLYDQGTPRSKKACSYINNDPSKGLCNKKPTSQVCGVINFPLKKYHFCDNIYI